MNNVPTSERVTGVIVKTHGIRGEIVVNIHTDEPEQRFAPGSSVLLRLKSGVVQQYTVAHSREHSRRLLLTLEGIHCKGAADELRGGQFFIQDSDLGIPEDNNEFYDYQLENLTVYTQSAPEITTQIGTVKEVLHLPAGDILSIKPSSPQIYATPELLIPFIKEFVPEINLAQGYITVNPPEGLWEEA